MLFAGARHWGYTDQQAMTMTFVSLVMIQFFKAYGYRSDHQSVLHKPFANRWLNTAIAWEVGLMFLIIYVPFLEQAFDVTPLSALEWLFLIFWSHTILPVLEFGKWLERKGVFGRHPDAAPPAAN
jgi:Ca2+-transporting ATPase